MKTANRTPPTASRSNVLHLSRGAYVHVGRGSNNGLLVAACNGPANYALVRLSRRELGKLIDTLRAEARRMDRGPKAARKKP